MGTRGEPTAESAAGAIGARGEQTSASNARARLLRAALADAGSTPEWESTVARLVVDAALAGDFAALEQMHASIQRQSSLCRAAMPDTTRAGRTDVAPPGPDTVVGDRRPDGIGNDPRTSAESAGQLRAFEEVSRWALERMSATAEAAQISIEPGGHASRFLAALSQDPGVDSTSLAIWLDLDKTQISRVGRGLVEQHLVDKRQLGRAMHWTLTPRGEYVHRRLRSTAAGRRAGESVAATRGRLDRWRLPKVADPAPAPRGEASSESWAVDLRAALAGDR